MAQEVPVQPACEAIILTALPVEFQAVLAHLQETREIIHPQGTIYRAGSFPREAGRLRVAVAQIGMGGGSAAVETERAIQFFRPQLSLFVGVAGGLKDVQLGDVVAATKVYAYESGKARQRFEPRPEVWRASHPLEQRARHEVSRDLWLARLHGSLPDPAPRAYIGALAAGEKVVSSTQSAVYRQIKATYGDALAIEMEGHGFLQAIHSNHDMHGLVIRGISDLIDNKTATDAGGSQTKAASHAAAFAFQIVATFTFLPSPSSSSYAVWNVPYLRNPYFTGRDDLLDQLIQQLAPEAQEQRMIMRRAALTQPRAIQGLGGIGKTQIAIEYAYRSRDLGWYVHILWINAANEEALLTSFVELAGLLPASSAKREKDQWKLVGAVKHWLELCQERWLLIFDNADEIALVRDFLPQGGNGSILLTTRSHAVGSLATLVEVETMGLLEGAHFLLRRAQRFEHASDDAMNQAGNIVAALDYFPLALDQAGAYIEETQCSLLDYLNLYQTHRQALLARRGMSLSGYLDSVATTWAVSFQKVQQANPAAAELLELCSFLAPDRIPEELLRDGVAYWPVSLQQAVSDPLLFQQLIADLLKFSLVKRLVEEHVLSIHRLVQVVQKDRMKRETQSHWAERVIQALNDVFPADPQDATTWQQCLRYLDQVQTCYELMEEYELALGAGADVLNRTGFYFYQHALYSMAERLYEHALTIREQQQEAGNLNSISTLKNLALLYDRQDKYTQAEQVYKRALAISEQQLEAKHSETASILSHLAWLYTKMGKRAEALPLYERALAINEQQLGTEHLDTVHSIIDLALEYDWQGLNDEVRQEKEMQAKQMYERALAIVERQFESLDLSNIVSVLDLTHLLALLYSCLNKRTQAEALNIIAAEIAKKHLGEEHPTTADRLDEAANLYSNANQYEQAQLFYQQAFRIRKHLLGLKHPDTVHSLFHLAQVASRQGHIQEAKPLYEQALSLSEQVLGKEHTSTWAIRLAYTTCLETPRVSETTE